MTETVKTNRPRLGKPPVRVAPESQKTKLLHLPGLVATCLYMLLLAFTVVLFVVKGHFPAICLVFSVLFTAGGLGLLKFLRWAWALTLAAAAMLAGLFLWNYTNQPHQQASLMVGLVNLIVFLYLVRTDIRDRLH